MSEEPLGTANDVNYQPHIDFFSTFNIIIDIFDVVNNDLLVTSTKFEDVVTEGEDIDGVLPSYVC